MRSPASKTALSRTTCCGNVPSGAWEVATTNSCHASATPISFEPWLKIQRSIRQRTVRAMSAKLSQTLGRSKPYFCRIGCDISACCCFSCLEVISNRRVSSFWAMANSSMPPSSRKCSGCRAYRVLPHTKMPTSVSLLERRWQT